MPARPRSARQSERATLSFSLGVPSPPRARSSSRCPRGTEASALAHQVSGLLRPGARVLDLGCGEGRDSVFFAERGFEVTGIDIARSGLAKAAETLAYGRGVKVRWICGDIGRMGGRRVVGGLFDLIYSCGVIHYVPRAVRAHLVPRLKVLTRAHGLHAHIVFTDRTVYVEKGEQIDYFAPGELASLSTDWAILTRQARVIDCDQDGTTHRHGTELLVARSRYRSTPAA
jgi:tellurite methyltransferase